MKKSITFLFMIFFVALLSGCFSMNQRTTKSSITTTFQTENPVDYNKIRSELYSEVYSELKRDIYDELVEELKEEFINGTIDYDNLQSRIIKTAQTATSGNVYVLNKRENENGEVVAYGSGSGVLFDRTDTSTTFGDFESKTLEKEYRYYLITNEHVVKDGKEYQVVFHDSTAVDAYLIGTDDTNDIAVLYFDSDNQYPLMKLGDSDALAVGEVVLAVGNPKGESLFGSITMCVVGGLNRNLIEADGTKNTINKYIQHDAAINGGNSGGGLYNLDGEVVGINSIKYVSTATSEIEGLNFAIPINLVKNICSEIREFGKYDGTVTFGITVASVSDLTNAGRTTYNVPESVTSGLVVIQIVTGGSSYNILNPNDIIIFADGVTVDDSSDLGGVLSRHRMGDTINVTVIRNGENVNLEITFHRVMDVEAEGSE